MSAPSTFDSETSAENATIMTMMLAAVTVSWRGRVSDHRTSVNGKLDHRRQLRLHRRQCRPTVLNTKGWRFLNRSLLCGDIEFRRKRSSKLMKKQIVITNDSSGRTAPDLSTLPDRCPIARLAAKAPARAQAPSIGQAVLGSGVS